MYPTLFSFGFLTLHSFGLMVALGVAGWFVISLKYSDVEKLPADTMIDLALYVIISSTLGARLIYVIGQWSYYRENPLEIIQLQNGGLVFLGGLAACLLTVWWYAKRKKIKLLKIYDVLAPGTLFGYAIGRLGCFLNGCCFGLPCDLPWALKFPPGSLAYAYYPDLHLHPTQLYSAVSMFLAFLLLVKLYPTKKFNGQIFFLALIMYSVYRFVVEFFRFSPMHWLGLTPSQWGVIVVVAAVAVVWRRYKLL